jgi:hypothetical protein
VPISPGTLVAAGCGACDGRSAAGGSTRGDGGGSGGSGIAGLEIDSGTSGVGVRSDCGDCQFDGVTVRCRTAAATGSTASKPPPMSAPA